MQFYKKFNKTENDFDSAGGGWVEALSIDGEGVFYGFDLAFTNTNNWFIKVELFDGESDEVSLKQIANEFKNIKNDRSIFTYESSGGNHILRCILGGKMRFENLRISCRRSGNKGYLESGQIVFLAGRGEF